VQWPADIVSQTIADGIRTQSLGSLNFLHVVSLVDEIVTVTEEGIMDAAVALLRRRHLVVEPAGAVSMAAVRSGSIPADGAAVIVSGGNASIEILSQMLQLVSQLDPVQQQPERDRSATPS
jgi:threonine dehydratase